MQKKIYITIDLPDEIRESFMKEEKRWKNLNVFWTGFSHYRLTLEYLGIVDKEGLRMIRQALEEITQETKPFDIRLDRMVLGPDEKEPRMFWATIFEDGTVKGLRRALREKLEGGGFVYPRSDFKPHVVLASAKGNQLKGKQTKVHLKGKFKVENLNLYASQTYGKGSVKFKLLDIFPLGK